MSAAALTSSEAENSIVNSKSVYADPFVDEVEDGTSVYLDPFMDDVVDKNELIEDDRQSELFVDRLVLVALIIVSSIGLITNFCLSASIVLLPRLHRAPNAFIVHQSLVDVIKSSLGLLHAHRALTDATLAAGDGGRSRSVDEYLFSCTSMSGSYAVLVTSSSINLLAVVMSEAYRFAEDLAFSVAGVEPPSERQSWSCVVFGVFTVWFTSLITNLGVIFIPGGAGGNYVVSGMRAPTSSCPFPVYRVDGNYVIQVLWAVLVTIGITLTIR